MKILKKSEKTTVEHCLKLSKLVKMYENCQKWSKVEICQKLSKIPIA